MKGEDGQPEMTEVETVRTFITPYVLPSMELSEDADGNKISIL